MAAELFRLLGPAALLGAVIGVLLQTPAKAAAVDVELVLAVDAGNGAGGVVGGQVEREPKARPNAAASTTHAERNVKPGLLQRVARRLESIRTIAISAFLLLLIIGLIGITVWEFRRKTVLIDPIQVPQDIADKGYRPEVVAKRLIDEVLAIRSEATTAKEMRGLTPEWTRADIQVPGAGLSVKSAVRYVKELLKFSGTRIGGEIIRDGKHLELRLRAHSDSLVVMNVPPHPEAELNKLIHLGAREVMKAIDPFILASYFHKRDSEASLKLINICLGNKRKNDDTWAYNLWGLILEEQGDEDGAIKKYRKAIQIDPKYALAYNNWGVSLQNKGDHDGAIKKYRKAIEVDPKDADAYNNWGVSLQNKGDHDGAIKKYQKAIEIDPKNADAYTNWGNTLYEQRDYDRSIEKYRKAIEVDPEYAGAYNNWGVSLQNKGDYDGAIGKYEKALKLDPNKFGYLEPQIKRLKAR